MIGFSGGTGSVALLDVVAKTYFSTPEDVKQANGKLKGGKDHPRLVDKSIWIGKPAVCYVEVCGAFPDVRPPLESKTFAKLSFQTADRTEEIRVLVEKYSDWFDFVPLRLEDSFDEKWWDSVGGGNLVAAARSFGLDMSDEGRSKSRVFYHITSTHIIFL